MKRRLLAGACGAPLLALDHAEARRRKGAEEERKGFCMWDYRYISKIHLVFNDNLVNNNPS
jgi:hypothetical protein